MTPTTEQQQAARPAAARGRFWGIWMMVLLGVWGCNKDTQLTYPKTFKLNNVNIDSFKFYRKGKDINFDPILPIKWIQDAFDQAEEEGKKTLESWLGAIIEIELLNDSQVRIAYKDPDNPNAKPEEEKFKYSLKDDFLIIENDSIPAQLAASLFAFDKDANSLYFFSRLSFFNYYDTVKKKRRYSDPDLSLVGNNDYNKNLILIALDPTINKKMQLGDTLALSMAKVVYKE